MTYPGWKSSDKVSPTITVNISYDEVAAKWRYVYSVSNGPSAAQQINEIILRFSAPAAIGSTPQGWDSFVVDTSGAIPGAVFTSLGNGFVKVRGGTAPSPGPAQIAAGQPLSGFEILSEYPPGESRTYVRGYAAVPYLPDTSEDAAVQPHDTTNSQRGWTLAPTLYKKIVTYGTKEATELGRANQLAAFLNVDTAGTFLRAPAVIAIRFDNGGDGNLVLRDTFKAFLNAVDVTSAFHHAPSNGRGRRGTKGADLVAVFALEPAGPLIAGANVLKTTVSGRLSRSIHARNVVDTDTIKFNVVASK